MKIDLEAGCGHYGENGTNYQQECWREDLCDRCAYAVKLRDAAREALKARERTGSLSDNYKDTFEGKMDALSSAVEGE